MGIYPQRYIFFFSGKKTQSFREFFRGAHDFKKVKITVVQCPISYLNHRYNTPLRTGQSVLVPAVTGSSAPDEAGPSVFGQLLDSVSSLFTPEAMVSTENA